jgi:diguanylate cyclase (GGDEF)-like protein
MVAVMLLSHDDILAALGPQGEETLKLFAEPPQEECGQPDVGTQLAFSLQSLDPQVAHYLQHDTLTGLSNRNHFQQQLTDALLESGRSGKKAAVVLIDVDSFRDLNIALGYEAGDAILVEIGRAIQAQLNTSCRVGRSGGDEFACVLSDLSSERQLHSATGELLTVINAIILKHTPAVHSGASLGAAVFPDHGIDAGTLLQNAEIALYKAKAEGWGQARIFEEPMRSALIDRLTQLSAFRTAVETGSLRPYYQPQIRLSDRRTYGFEALARWILPNGDILYPGHFQIALDDPDAAILLGEHMLRSISDDLQQWREARLPACKVSVNATASELKRGDYPRKVAELFQAKRIPLSQLTVEITESVLLDDKTSQIAQALSELRHMGVSIALDDFGTGFASLTHLKSYPVDQIKIDRSFVKELPFNPGDRAIVRATLNLAKNLRIETVAEGLEDEMQLKYLQSLGCDYGQGYFFSRAVPAAEAEAYFRLHRAHRKAKLHQFVLSTPATPRLA